MRSCVFYHFYLIITVPCTQSTGRLAHGRPWKSNKMNLTPTTTTPQLCNRKKRKTYLWDQYIDAFFLISIFYVSIYIYIYTYIGILWMTTTRCNSQRSEIWNSPVSFQPAPPSAPAWRVGLVVIHVDDFAVVVNAEGHLCRRMPALCLPRGDPV